MDFDKMSSSEILIKTRKLQTLKNTFSTLITSLQEVIALVNKIQFIHRKFIVNTGLLDNQIKSIKDLFSEQKLQDLEKESQVFTKKKIIQDYLKIEQEYNKLTEYYEKIDRIYYKETIEELINDFF